MDAACIVPTGLRAPFTPLGALARGKKVARSRRYQEHRRRMGRGLLRKQFLRTMSERQQGFAWSIVRDTARLFENMDLFTNLPGGREPEGGIEYIHTRRSSGPRRYSQGR